MFWSSSTRFLTLPSFWEIVNNFVPWIALTLIFSTVWENFPALSVKCVWADESLAVWFFEAPILFLIAVWCKMTPWTFTWVTTIKMTASKLRKFKNPKWRIGSWLLSNLFKTSHLVAYKQRYKTDWIAKIVWDCTCVVVTTIVSSHYSIYFLKKWPNAVPKSNAAMNNTNRR